jgi:hypothetical protein
MQGHLRSNTKPQTPNGWIEISRIKGHKYARLRWTQGGKGVHLGACGDYPTGLLDLTLAVAHKLPLFELRKLQFANKSMRD